MMTDPAPPHLLLVLVKRDVVHAIASVHAKVLRPELNQALNGMYIDLLVVSLSLQRISVVKDLSH